MGPLDFLSNLFTERAKDWTYEPFQDTQVPDHLGRKEIQADTAYLSIFLRSMRIVNVRRGTLKFYGVVHSFISLPHLSGDKAQFHVITTPSNLRDVDASNIDRVITLNQRLVGPVPYMGGDLQIEVGLFSVKTANLAGPFLSVLEGLANAAGVSYVNVARPFIGPLLEGVNLLAGAKGDTWLEIGLYETFPRPETGYIAVIGAPKGAVKVSDLRVDSDYRLFDSTGRSLADYPYMIIAIETSPTRDDWFDIPELKSAYQGLRSDVRGGKIEPVKESFAIFKRTALTCPDLLTDHKDKVVEKVKDEVDKALGTTLTAAGRHEIPELNAINLYE